MPQITIHDLGNGKKDVVLLVSETTVTVQQSVFSEDGSDSIEEKEMYEYDGNIFRTCKDITEEDILADIETYLDYEGDEEPTQEMVDYANEMIDTYTMQLIEEGTL